MVNKVTGLVAAGITGGALALGGGYYDLSKKIADQQIKHTTTLENNNAQWTENWNSHEQVWRSKFGKQETDYTKLHTAYKESRNNLSDLTKKLETTYTELENNKTQVNTAMDKLNEVKNNYKTVFDKVNNVDNKVGDLEKGWEIVSKRVEGVEEGVKGIGTKVDTVSAKVNNIKTGDQIMDELYEKRSPSVVGILFRTLHNGKIDTGSLTGSIIQNKKGEYEILTAGHGFQKPIVNGMLTILLKQGGHFNINLAETEIHVLGYPGRDCALIRVPERYQLPLKNLKIEGIPIAPATARPKEANTLLVIGENWQPYPVTFAGEKRQWYGWEFEKVDYETRGGPTKKGDSGSPMIGKDGYLYGMLSTMGNVTVIVPMIVDGKDGKKEVKSILLPVEGAVAPRQQFVSAQDIQRTLRGFGFDGFSNEDRNHLVKRDILELRPYLLAPPIPGPLLSGDLMPYLADLSNVGHLLPKNE